MDITIDVEDYKLNMRAAVIIIHNNKILVHKNVHSDHYALVGGRIMVGENSSETVKREVLEELGKEIVIEEYIATLENFFEMKKSKYHEIMFVYKAEFKNEEDRYIESKMENREGKDYLIYEWIELNKINEYKILPEVIKEILLEKNYPTHKINDELKHK